MFSAMLVCDAWPGDRLGLDGPVGFPMFGGLCTASFSALCLSLSLLSVVARSLKAFVMFSTMFICDGWPEDR